MDNKCDDDSFTYKHFDHTLCICKYLSSGDKTQYIVLTSQKILHKLVCVGIIPDLKDDCVAHILIFGNILLLMGFSQTLNLKSQLRQNNHGFVSELYNRKLSYQIKLR